MSEKKNVPKLPPPDDFSKTTPNIPVSRDDAPSDWEKTNYNQNFAPQPPADDWGKTVANYNAPPDETDFGKTFIPGAKSAKTPDWEMTQENIELPREYQKQEDFSSRDETFGATTPYFRLPDEERAKYQNPPPPVEEAGQKKEEKRGVPTWMWISAGMATMFVFFLVVLAAVYFLFLNKSGFNVTVRRAPAESKIFVDGSQWGVSDENGMTILQGLQAGVGKKIEIKNDNYKCEPFDLTGKDGETQEITARCSQISIPLDASKNVDCKIPPKLGEFEKAEKCANIALDNLPKPNFSADELTRALNIFIINFDSGKSDIPPERMTFLRRAAEFIQKLPASTVLEIGGHTDNVGTNEDNQILSENRAKAVRDALIRFGAKSDVFQTKGYGESIQKVENNTEQNRFYNRRIEYSVIKQ